MYHKQIISQIKPVVCSVPTTSIKMQMYLQKVQKGSIE